MESQLQLRGKAQDEWHQRAGARRDEIFGRKVFVRGVVEVSNFCRQNCSYCGMRRDNRDLGRYRLELDKILDLVVHHRPASLTDINLQAGEDPVAVREIIIPLVREIRRQTNLGVSVCLGTLSAKEYDALREAGASYYIIKIETGNAGHFQTLQAPGTLAKRVAAIEHLARTGWAVSSGFIVGLPGQDVEMVQESLDLLGRLPLAGVSVSPFIAGEQTPLAGETPGDLELTLNCVASMRLSHPERVIPAVSAMRIADPAGYRRALGAGANLATINLTPSEWRENYLLYKRERFIMDEERILTEIAAAECEPSTVGLAEFLEQSAPVMVK
jgi:biotin synthase